MKTITRKKMIENLLAMPLNAICGTRDYGTSCPITKQIEVEHPEYENDVYTGTKRVRIGEKQQDLLQWQAGFVDDIDELVFYDRATALLQYLGISNTASVSETTVCEALLALGVTEEAIHAHATKGVSA